MSAPHPLAQRFVSALMRRRGPLLLLVGLVTLLAGAAAARLELDTSITVWFLEDDPALVVYREFVDRFGVDELVVVGVTAPAGDPRGIWTPAHLATVDRIGQALEQAPHAGQVRSLAALDVIESTDGMIRVGPLAEELPQTDVEAETLRRRVDAMPLVRDALVSPDGRTTVVTVELDPHANDFSQKTEMVTAIAEVLERERADTGLELRLTGTPAVDAAFAEANLRDMTLLAPLSSLVVVAVCFAVFRRLSAALVPLVVVGLATAWTFGFIGLVGWKISALAGGMSMVVLSVGVADTVHVLSETRKWMAAGLPRSAAIEAALAELLAPCLFTTLTTVVGFLSLLVSQVVPIREFGVGCAVGVVSAFLLTYTVLPALLRWAPAPDPALLERQRTGPLGRLLERMARPGRGWRRGVLSVFVIALIGTAFAIPRLDVGADPLRYFRADVPIRVQTEALEAEMGGTSGFEIVITAPDEGLKDPAVLARLAQIEDWLLEVPGISRSMSVTGVLEETNRVLHDGDPAWARLPDSRAMAAQLYLVLEGSEDLTRLVSADYSQSHMTLAAEMGRYHDLLEHLDAIEARLTEHSDAALQLHATGYAVLIGSVDNYLLESQIKSLLVAFCAILAMVALLLRSPALAAWSMIPNLAPVLMGIACMAVVGVPLDPGTVMVGCVALGLVVDDTIHMLVRIRRHRTAGATVPDALAGAMADTGRAIIITTIVLASGFGTLLVASFVPAAHFGLITSGVVVLALVCDLVVLPAAMTWAWERRQRS